MLRFGLVVCALLVQVSCTADKSGRGSGESSATVELRACRVEGLRDEARCGTLVVFEDREAKKGREITLHFAVVPALAATPEPDPLFLLMGGPGQSALGSGAGMVRALQEVRRHRDIVLLDQRGTGKSNPLPCQNEKEQPLQNIFRAGIDLQEVRDCLGKLDADTRHYSTPTAMDDLNDVRRALGYAKINLWGGSYGTRAALVYSRRHPESLRRMVLDGVAPLEIKLPLHSGDDAQRAINMLSARCAAQKECHALVPNVTEKLNRIVARLSQQPEVVQLTHPRTAQNESFTMTAPAFAAGLRALLYVPTMAALIPMALAAIERGDYEPYVALVLTLTDGISSDMQYGMMLSVLCAEDMSQVDEVQVSQFTNNFLGRAALDSMRKACEIWPHASLPAEYFGPMKSSAPTLILSGELDPVTPPRWGELVAGPLAQAKHVVVSGLAHGVSSVSCMPHAISEFLSSEAPLEVPVVCAKKLKPPPFFVNSMGSLQ